MNKWSMHPFGCTNDLWPLGSPKSPKAIGFQDATIEYVLSGIEAAFYSKEMAELVLLLHNEFKPDFSEEQFFKIERAFTACQSVADLTIGPQVTGSSWLSTAWPLVATTKNEQGRVQRKVVGYTVHGDGSDTHSNAQHIIELIAKAKQYLIDASAVLFVEREVEKQTIKLSVQHADLFDAEKWRLTPTYNNGDTRVKIGTDVVSVKTGQRLADAVLGTDGLVLQAAGPRGDFRLSSLHPVDRRQFFTLMLTPEEIARLTEVSNRTGQDVGRLLGVMTNVV